MKKPYISRNNNAVNNKMGVLTVESKCIAKMLIKDKMMLSVLLA